MYYPELGSMLEKEKAVNNVIARLHKILNMDCGFLGIGKLQCVSLIYPRARFCSIYEPEVVFMC